MSNKAANQFLYTYKDILLFCSPQTERFFTYGDKPWNYAKYCKLTKDNKSIWYYEDGSISKAYDSLNWGIRNIEASILDKEMIEIENPFNRT